MLGITIGLKQLALAFNDQWNIMYPYMKPRIQGMRSLYHSRLLQTHKQKSFIYFVPLELLGRGDLILLFEFRVYKVEVAELAIDVRAQNTGGRLLRPIVSIITPRHLRMHGINSCGNCFWYQY